MDESGTQTVAYCPHCGAGIAEPDAKFCVACGGDLAVAQVPQTGVAQGSSLPASVPAAPAAGPSAAPASISGAALAPEKGFVYSLLLTPIAGAIFFSRNWKRIGLPQNWILTWLSAIVVLGIYGWAISAGLPTVVGVLLSVIWQLAMYLWQRPHTRQRSTTAWIAAAVLLVLSLGYTR